MFSLIGTSGTPPAFPTDFYTGEFEALAINQGGYNIKNGACCSHSDSPQCKIQAIAMGSDVREQGTMNRTRSDSAQGTIVTWFAPVNKQMALLPGSSANSSHAFVCAQACPQDGSFISSVLIGDGHKGIFDTPRDKGQATVTQPALAGGATKECEHWSWTETILKLIPLAKHDFFVDKSASPDVPFFASQTIEPLGKPIGQENVSYIDFNGTDVSTYFDIDPDSIKKCPPPENGCGDNPSLAAASRRFGEMRFFKSMHQQAIEMALSGDVPVAPVAKARADPPPEPNVTFGTDFVANEDHIMVINQGGKTTPSGDICCDGSAVQCQVQLQHAAGMRYFDLTNQRERFDDTVGKQVQIDFYELKKSILVNVTDGIETCQEYCPIDPDDKMEKFDPFDPFDKVKDLGKTSYEGQLVEHYQWSDMIFKIIKMQTTDFYAAFSGDTATPVAANTVITPFGSAPIGSQNQTWTNWKPGTPPKEKFNIAGLDTCPRSNNCGSSQMQAHRLQAHQFHSFYRHLAAQPLH